MLTRFLEAAMELAEFEAMEDGTWFGRIPDFKGLWANAETQDACRVELRSALEDWILFSLRREQTIPVVNGIDLTITEVA
jgi:predicted RNase H-like HicB family nuclease